MLATWLLGEEGDCQLHWAELHPEDKLLEGHRLRLETLERSMLREEGGCRDR